MLGILQVCILVDLVIRPEPESVVSEFFKFFLYLGTASVQRLNVARSPCSLEPSYHIFGAFLIDDQKISRLYQHPTLDVQQVLQSKYEMGKTLTRRASYKT